MTPPRRAFLAIAGAGAVSLALDALAQAAKPARIAVLASGTPESHGYLVDAFRAAMRDLGYAEGRDVVYDVRWAEGYVERLPKLAVELARGRPDIVVTATAAATRAAMDASPAAAILMAYGSDPVGNGLVASLARPGGRVTGLSNLGEGLVGKMFELLRTLTPSAQRLGLLVNSANMTAAVYRADAEAAARVLKAALVHANAGSPEDLPGVFERLKRERTQGVVVAPDPMFLAMRTKIVALAARGGVPAIYNQREFVEEGGLMSYGPSIRDAYARAAVFADRILKGANPGDLPVEQPTKFSLAINVAAARSLGIAVPQELLLRADTVVQ